MHKNIKIREDFTDVDISKVSRISYEPYLEVPSCTDYIKDERRKIVLKNTMSDQLEQISYQLVGAVPFSSKPGYYWYWGKINARDYNCYLAFYFNGDGSLKSITASFAGEGPTDEEFKDINNRISYGAEFSNCGAF